MVFVSHKVKGRNGEVLFSKESKEGIDLVSELKPPHKFLLTQLFCLIDKKQARFAMPSPGHNNPGE